MEQVNYNLSEVNEDAANEVWNSVLNKILAVGRPLDPSSTVPVVAPDRKLPAHLQINGRQMVSSSNPSFATDDFLLLRQQHSFKTHPVATSHDGIASVYS